MSTVSYSTQNDLLLKKLMDLLQEILKFHYVLLIGLRQITQNKTLHYIILRINTEINVGSKFM